MVIHKFTLKISEETPEENIAKAIMDNRVGRGNKRVCFYVTQVKPDELTLCEIGSADVDPIEALIKYLAKHKIEPVSVDGREITVRECAELLEEGHSSNICPEIPEAFGPYGLMPFVAEPFSSAISEIQCIGDLEKGEAKDAASTFLSKSLQEEIERVYKSEDVPFCGHPVLYSICTEKKSASQSMAGLLMSSLFAAGRLKSNRAAILNMEEMPLPNELISDLFHAQSGSCIMVEVPDFGEEEPAKKANTDGKLKYICSLARENRDKVLTIFLSTPQQKDKLCEIERDLRRVSLYKIFEEKVSRKESEKRLRAMAKDVGCNSVAGLCKSLPKDKDAFSNAELKAVFSKWYDEFLRTKVYPDYADVCKKPSVKKEEPKETISAFEELSNLIGLTQAKTILSQARDFAKAQKIYIKHGYSTKMPCLHMAFCGNPGTAKTTVARLTARIFKECGVLERGELIEVSRSDLVGKYVGWTAKAVSKKFKEAEGSVLFIDEAYSLLDDREGMFGDEAINQITLEMENHRDNVVVIFAGYKEPMESFINRNAGLRSRIAFKVDFPDYSEDEMVEIVRMNLEQNKRKITQEGEEKVRLLIRAGMKNPHYGNGRYARELVEQAMLSQASRLVKLPEEQITDEGICYLTAEDFPEPIEEKPEKRHIGFACA